MPSPEPPVTSISIQPSVYPLHDTSNSPAYSDTSKEDIANSSGSSSKKSWVYEQLLSSVIITV